MPSLCETCAHCRLVRTERSRFLLCKLSQTNAAFPKYPPQPVFACPGYTEDKARADEIPPPPAN